MHLLSLYRSVLHLGITIVMHRYPRVGHAAITYMVSYKIDRSILTGKIQIIRKTNAQSNDLKYFKSYKWYFVNWFFKMIIIHQKCQTFNKNGIYEILDSLQRKVWHFLSWGEERMWLKVTEQRPHLCNKWKFGKINIFNNKIRNVKTCIP